MRNRKKIFCLLWMGLVLWLLASCTQKEKFTVTTTYNRTLADKGDVVYFIGLDQGIYAFDEETATLFASPPPKQGENGEVEENGSLLLYRGELYLSSFVYRKTESGYRFSLRLYSLSQGEKSLLTEISLPSVYPFPRASSSFCAFEEDAFYFFSQTGDQNAPYAVQGIALSDFSLLSKRELDFFPEPSFFGNFIKGKTIFRFLPRTEEAEVFEDPESGGRSIFVDQSHKTLPSGLPVEDGCLLLWDSLFVSESGEETPFSLSEGTIRYAFSDGETALLLVQNKEQTAFSSTHLYTLYRGTKDGFSLLTENASLFEYNAFSSKRFQFDGDSLLIQSTVELPAVMACTPTALPKMENRFSDADPDYRYQYLYSLEEETLYCVFYGVREE